MLFHHKNDSTVKFRAKGHALIVDFEGHSVIKEKQSVALKKWALQDRCRITDLPSSWQYLTHGEKARIYLDARQKNVIKLNHGFYYATWLEYFNSLVLHNLFSGHCLRLYSKG